MEFIQEIPKEGWAFIVICGVIALIAVCSPWRRTTGGSYRGAASRPE
jgi:hypothetical protein